MENRPDREQSREIEVFLPRSVELLTRDDLPRPQPMRYDRRRSRKRLALWLFVATCVTTFLAGTQVHLAILIPEVFQRLVEKELLGTVLLNGLTYSAVLMSMLMFHEMGHYLQAKRYNVPASLPFFIPMPIPPIGTMGAVIVQGGGVADRKQMFDIAITGPLAGLLIALPAMYFGVMHAKIIDTPPNATGIAFGDPLIIKWAVAWLHQPLQPGQDVELNPVLFAAWVGIFITALNLIPIGQLDGGHILYCLIGKRAHVVAVAVLLAAMGYMVYSRQFAYSLMVVLLLLMGPRHPPTADDTVALGSFRVVLGWLTLAFIVIGFTPTPIVSMP